MKTRMYYARLNHKHSRSSTARAQQSQRTICEVQEVALFIKRQASQDCEAMLSIHDNVL